MDQGCSTEAWDKDRELDKDEGWGMGKELEWGRDEDKVACNQVYHQRPSEEGCKRHIHS